MKFVDRKNRSISSRLTKSINSQKGQDYWVINEVFQGKKGGYFLEMGASDGVYK